ncbi:MAG: hypothetical protein AAFV86_07735, partial [Pseudomonadota bacterium]
GRVAVTLGLKHPGETETLGRLGEDHLLAAPEMADAIAALATQPRPARAAEAPVAARSDAALPGASMGGLMGGLEAVTARAAALVAPYAAAGE